MRNCYNIIRISKGGENLLERLYNPEKMLKPDKWVGKCPPAKTVYRTLFKTVWPSTLEAMLMSLMNFVDTLMVSSIGTYAVAATGLTNQPRLVFFAMFFAMNVGVTAIVSRRKGQEDRAGANRCLSQSMLLCVIMSVVLCAVAIAVARPLMVLAGALEDTIEPAMTYFRIVMVGMVFSSFGMVINAAQRGSGNTKISMYTNVAANIVNVIFNYLLINGIGFFPRMGVKGAAIATMLGNIVSCVMSIYTIRPKHGGYLSVKVRDCFIWDKGTMHSIVKVSFSAAVEQIFVRIGFFAYARVVATLGTTALATHQICMSIINFSFSLGDGLSTGTSGLVGQSLGRKRPDMAAVYGKCAQRAGFCISLIMFCLFTGGGGFLMSLFTKETEIIEMGSNLLLITGFAAIAQISSLVYLGCLRGAGDTKYVAIASMVSIACVRPIVTYVLCFPLGLGLIGAWISLLIDQCMRFTFAVTRFSTGNWSRIEL